MAADTSEGRGPQSGTRRWRWLLIPSLVASLAIAPPLQAQTPATRFEHLSVEDGLSHSAIMAIAQDRYGFLWIGTRNGLNRYDGYRFRVFQHDPEDPTSLADSDIDSIYEDRSGELWIGTSGGLHRFDRAEERFIRYLHDPEDPRSLSHNFVTAIFEDHTRTLWIATYGGLNRLAADGAFQHYLHDPADARALSDSWVETLAEDGEGRLWVGTNGGLDLYDRPSGTFRHYRHDPANPQGLSDNRISAIREDADGNLWVGTDRGLNRFDRETETFTRYRHGPVDLTTERIIELGADREGELWVGTFNAGLIRIPRGAAPPVQYRHHPADPRSLSGDRVLSIFEDRSGILWFGTWVGLNKYDRRLEQFALYRWEPGRDQTLTDSNISAILEDRSGVLWVGTWDKGLNRVDRQRSTVVQYRPDAEDPRSLPADTVEALCEDRSGVLWVGTLGGLARLDPARGTFTVYRNDPEVDSSLDHDTVYRIYEDRRGRLWIGTGVGLCRFEPATESFVRYRLSDEPEVNVFSILEDHAGILWVGSRSHGLFQLDPDAAESRDPLRHRHDPADDNSLGHDDVNYLYEDRSGNLWIGTDGAGLDRLDRLPERPARERFTHYREEDGLAGNQVVGILEDDTGHLWLSTSQGLSRLDPRTGEFRNFSIEDGLQSHVFSYRSAFRSPSGEMFFGGIHGFNAFFPDQIGSDPHGPGVVLTDFQLFNDSVPLRRVDSESPLEHSILATTELRLSHRHDVFSLEFAALHYANPQKNRYAYRLEGFDSDWTTTDAGKRFATYTNLDAGRYRFRVRGSNPSGVWSEEEATLWIVVAPPPWKSWWAYTLYALALSAAVVSAVRAQRRKLDKERAARQKELEQERAARQKELEQERAVSRRLREVDKLKDDFLANTSHELRTPLYGITGLAESLIDGVAGKVPSAVKSNLAMIVSSGRRLSHLVNDILDFSQLRHQSLELTRRPVDLRPLVEVVLALSRPLVGSKSLVLTNAVPGDLPPADADEDRLQQILHNLVGNAVKFTESGSVEVAAEAVDAQLVVRVTDTGIGILKEEHERIFDAFEQADASTEREFGGTGLGLAVTRQLVALHGGEIEMQSTPGEGSTFAFTLPIAAAEATSAAEITIPAALEIDSVPDAPEVTAEPRPAGEDSARILVVDDEPVIRQVLVNQLAAEGYAITQATSGAEALAQIEECLPDLVLLDVMMPRMSGYEVCRTLRKRNSLEELPVVFLTAKGQPSDLVVGLAAGANDYLPKPVSKSELLARVRTHLALLDVHRQLSQLVEERTSQLAERDLLLAERERLIGELEMRNADLARFNYTVAHDLKNPLTTIRNFIGLLERDAEQGDHDRLRQDLRRIDDAASTLHRLLDELYEFSRVDHPPIPCEEVALGELVSHVLSDLADVIAERGVEVEVAADLPAVCGDRRRLRQVVRHLMQNAVDYLGDQPSPRVEVGVRDQEPPVFYVRDNGQGIDPRYHEKIFGLFQRLSPEASDGTGVGLALVKRIVEIHGGRIWVESEGRGRGSTFCLTLPGVGAA